MKLGKQYRRRDGNDLQFGKTIGTFIDRGGNGWPIFDLKDNQRCMINAPDALFEEVMHEWKESKTATQSGEHHASRCADKGRSENDEKKMEASKLETAVASNENWCLEIRRYDMARGDTSTYVPCPAKHMLEWDGQSGTLKMWDAANKEKVQLELPFGFAWVEEFGYLSGYSNQLKTSFHSNEVHGRHLKSKKFEVYHFEKSGNEHKKVPDIEGLYHDIKPELAKMGASFCKMIYAIALQDNGPVKKGDYIRILASPAFCQEWYDFGKTNQVDSGAVFVDGHIPRQNGNVSYLSPVFVMDTIDKEMDAKAVAAVKPLKAYYLQKPDAPPVDESSQVNDDYVDDSDQVDPDEVPF
jgi:hypothetical protein